MSRFVRRSAIGAALAGLVYATWRYLAAHKPDTEGLTFQAQPFPLPPRPIPIAVRPNSGNDHDSSSDSSPDGVAVAAAVAAAVAPDGDGQCPVTHPIKGKQTSGIYHQPGGFAYERTHADRCYRDTSAAEDDGLRAAKR